MNLDERLNNTERDIHGRSLGNGIRISQLMGIRWGERYTLFGAVLYSFFEKYGGPRRRKSMSLLI